MKNRNTTLKKIFAAKSIKEKKTLAYGIDPLHPLKFPRTDGEALAFVEQIRWMGSWALKKGAKATREEHRLMGPHFTRLAWVITAAVMDKAEHGLFFKIGNILRHRKPEANKLYWEILDFCDRTKKRPFDRAELLKHLRTRKPKHQQSERQIFETCKKLGIVLTPRKSGRPKTIRK